MFFFKKKDLKNENIIKIRQDNRLSIVFKDHTKLSWTCKNYSEKSLIKPWRKFYKWYFGSKKEDFVLVCKNGHTMFRRSDIMQFSIDLIDTKVCDHQS